MSLLSRSTLCYSAPVHTGAFQFIARSRDTGSPSSSVFGSSCLFSSTNESSHLCSFKLMASRSESSAGAQASEESISNKLRLMFHREYVFAIYTPFVVGLASGTLKLDSFRHFISQDVHFLAAFSAAYEKAKEYTDEDEDKIELSNLRNNVLEELRMHKSFIQEWGADIVKEHSDMHSATAKYIDFLQTTTAGNVEEVKGLNKLDTPFEKTKIAAYILGAMTPCMRLYASLAKELLALLDPRESNNLYKKWIDSYASESFEALAQKIEGLLDKLSLSLTGEELVRVEKLYHQAMNLEVEFFSAQPLLENAVVPLIREHNPAEFRLIIFSDFDLTCTIIDSSTILAEIAIITASKSNESQNENQISYFPLKDVKSMWDVLSRQYTDEYEQCIKNIMPVKKLEFDYELVYNALWQISDFEKRANLKVIESNVLKCLNVEDIRNAGRHLKLQDGCANFFQKLVANEKANKDVHILSYCWCGDLIRSIFSSVGLPNMNICSNELVYKDSSCTGNIMWKIESPIDKLEAVRNILKQYGPTRRKFSIYIGDSLGDLLCLLEADVGIVYGSSSSLWQVGAEFGISFMPLYPCVVKGQKECTDIDCFSLERCPGTLYTVSSWHEIHAFILGCQS